jgi:hypothetical protein
MNLTNVTVRIGCSDIGIAPNLNEVQDILSSYDCINLIAIFTTLNVSIASLGDENDKALRNIFINPHANQKLSECEKELRKEAIVFNRQAILVLIDMSMKFGKRSYVKDINLLDIGYLVLVINSFIAFLENKFIEEKQPTNIDVYADHASKQYIFNSKPQMRYSIPRGFLMYKGLRESVKEHFKYIDIDNLFLKNRKINFADYYDLMIIIYSHFGDFKMEYFETGRFIQREVIFRDIKSDKEKYLNFLDSISINVDSYVPSIPDYEDFNAWFSYIYKFYDYRLKPLIKVTVPEGVLYFCTDLQFIINSFWDAPYNIILTDYRGDKKLIEDFFGFLGDTLEVYMQKLSAYTFKEKFKLYELKTKVPLNDGVIQVTPEWVIIIETKAARPTQEMTAGLNPIENIADFDKIVRKGMVQLNKRIKEYRREGFTGRITPILIGSSFIPLNSLIWSRYRSKLSDLEIFRGMTDHPILMDIESWEVVCASSIFSNDLIELINKKLSTNDLIEMSFHDFLYGEYFHGDEPPLNELLTLKKDLWSQAITNLFQRESNLVSSGAHWTKVFGDISL